MIDWNFIKRSDEPVVMDELGYHLKLVSPELFQISEHEFVFASSENYGGILLGLIFYWAPSVGALVRAHGRDASADSGELIAPPLELLIDGWRWSYDEILKACQTNKLGRYITGNIHVRDYRVGRMILVDKYTYFFRDHEDPGDKAFAVGLDIRGIRWVMCG